MEILTLLRANMKKKKGTMLSILVLMMIITTVSTAIFSVRDNYEKGMDAAFAENDIGDAIVFILKERLTENMKSSVEESSLVRQVSYYDSIWANEIQCGKMENSNTSYMTEMRSGVLLFNQELTAFEAEIPELKSGEIYLPLGLKSQLSCEVGDSITVNVIYDMEETFTIRGFVQEPSMGSMMIGWKQIFISHEDYARIYEKCLSLDGDKSWDIALVALYQPEGSGLSPAVFLRRLNLETKLVDNGLGALSREQSERYSTLMPDVILNIMLVFIGFLFMIVLIVMSHSIGTEIEIEYTTLGILKSQGFDDGKIRMVYFLQYLLAEAAGMCLGVAAAIPIEGCISGIFQPVTAILPQNGLAVGKSVLSLGFFLLASVLVIWVKTGRLVKISPVRAITGGREPVYFDSRIQMPISKRLLSASLGFRQISSGAKRYMGITLIVVILTFFMITVNLIGELLSSRKALDAMGLTISDMEMYVSAEEEAEIIKMIEAYSPIKEASGIFQDYLSLNGESLSCDAYEKPEYIHGILKGRAPLYDNEIVITEMIAEVLGLKMGDEVTVSMEDEEAKYLISGIYQSNSDAGMCFAVSIAGIERLGYKREKLYTYFILEDKSKVDVIADRLSEAYGEGIYLNVYDEDNNPVQVEFQQIVSVLKMLIYGFSLLFAFVVVRMVCQKTFIQERTDIGIYKAVGFTAAKLRLSFAVRFLLISLTGAVLGTALSGLLSARALSMVLGLIGFSKVVLEFTLFSVLVPILTIGMGFFLFAYLASGSIKRVEVRELIVE